MDNVLARHLSCVGRELVDVVAELELPQHHWPIVVADLVSSSAARPFGSYSPPSGSSSSASSRAFSCFFASDRTFDSASFTALGRSRTASSLTSWVSHLIPLPSSTRRTLTSDSHSRSTLRDPTESAYSSRVLISKPSCVPAPPKSWMLPCFRATDTSSSATMLGFATTRRKTTHTRTIVPRPAANSWSSAQTATTLSNQGPAFSAAASARCQCLFTTGSPHRLADCAGHTTRLQNAVISRIRDDRLHPHKEEVAAAGRLGFGHLVPRKHNDAAAGQVSTFRELPLDR